jgi:hypothetical protein
MIRQYPAPRLAFSGACHDDKLARYGSHVGNTSAVLKAPFPQDAERKTAVPQSNHNRRGDQQLCSALLCSEIFKICSEIHTTRGRQKPPQSD